MWSKNNQLSRQFLSQMQIAMKLGISRDTVHRYQRMNEKVYKELISSEILRWKRKLDAFEGCIKQLLQDCPFLSAAQIHDRLKDHFPELLPLLLVVLQPLNPPLVRKMLYLEV